MARDVWKVHGGGEISGAAVRVVNVEIGRAELLAVMGTSEFGESAFLTVSAGSTSSLDYGLSMLAIAVPSLRDAGLPPAETVRPPR